MCDASAHSATSFQAEWPEGHPPRLSRESLTAQRSHFRFRDVEARLHQEEVRENLPGERVRDSSSLAHLTHHSCAQVAAEHPQGSRKLTDEDISAYQQLPKAFDEFIGLGLISNTTGQRLVRMLIEEVCCHRSPLAMMTDAWIALLSPGYSVVTGISEETRQRLCSR